VVKRKLDRFLQEFQDGKHEGSVVTTQTVESLSMDEKQTWRIIRKELEDIGITVAVFDANKDFIMKWFKEAITSGAFEEQLPEDSPSGQACEDDVGRLREGLQCHTAGRSVTTSLDSLTIQDTPTQDSTTLEAQPTHAGIAQKAASPLALLPPGNLSNSAETLRI
jgi:hypothetical protein